MSSVDSYTLDKPVEFHRTMLVSHADARRAFLLIQTDLDLSLSACLAATTQRNANHDGMALLDHFGQDKLVLLAKQRRVCAFLSSSGNLKVLVRSLRVLESPRIVLATR